MSRQVLAGAFEELQARLDRIPGIGIELSEGQILELVLEALHADAFGERRIDVHGLARDPAALFLRLDAVQGAHVVQPVGQLDQKHPDVLRHGQDQLAEILGVLGLLGLQLKTGQLGHAVDQTRDVPAEDLLDVFPAWLRCPRPHRGAGR